MQLVQKHADRWPAQQAQVRLRHEQFRARRHASMPAGRCAPRAALLRAFLTARDISAHPGPCTISCHRHRLQGWGLKLGRVLSFIAGTSYIDLATALGFPPYLGGVRALLIALHWATPPAVVWVAFHGGTPAVLALMASSVAWAIGDQDLPARAQGLAALQAGQATAAELWEESRVAEACPRLSGALFATADCYAAVLVRDRQRREDMRQMERLYRSWLT